MVEGANVAARGAIKEPPAIADGTVVEISKCRATTICYAALLALVDAIAVATTSLHQDMHDGSTVSVDVSIDPLADMRW